MKWETDAAENRIKEIQDELTGLLDLEDQLELALELSDLETYMDYYGE